jgi:hypothetical protein
MMRSDDVVPTPKAKARSRKRVVGHGDIDTLQHKDGTQPVAKMPRKGFEFEILSFKDTSVLGV